MKKFVSMVFVCLLMADVLASAGIGSDDTQYVGGTENQIKDGTEGKSSAKDEKIFIFEYKGVKLERFHTIK